MAAIRKNLIKYILKNYIPGGTAPRVVVPNGVVLLHQMPIGNRVPMLSNFAVKLETYLRMAEIPYENSFEPKFSSKRKIPWIEYNGRKIADSSFCIDFLNEEFNVNLDGKLNQTERVISHAIQRMLEENTYWTMVYYRWCDNAQDTGKLFLPKVTNTFVRDMMTKMFQKGAKTNMIGQGMGRHTSSEVYSIARKDLQSLSDYLATKPFIMGQEPTQVDATTFGLLAQFLWQDVSSPQNALLNSELKNLRVYCERMQEIYWPDWDEAIAQRKKLQ